MTMKKDKEDKKWDTQLRKVKERARQEGVHLYMYIYIHTYCQPHCLSFCLFVWLAVHLNAFISLLLFQNLYIYIYIYQRDRSLRGSQRWRGRVWRGSWRWPRHYLRLKLYTGAGIGHRRAGEKDYSAQRQQHSTNACATAGAGGWEQTSPL